MCTKLIVDNSLFNHLMVGTKAKTKIEAVWKASNEYLALKKKDDLLLLICMLEIEEVSQEWR